MEFGAALRSRYGSAQRCACLVDGEPCAPERVSRRTMNFGQHWRTEEGIVEVEYAVEVPRALLSDLLGEVLPELVDDCRKYPDPDDRLDRVLRAANWPGAGDVMADPELRRFFADWFAADLLLHWFGSDSLDAPADFVLNTVDAVDAGDERVVAIRGRGRRAGMPVRYQDV